MSFSITPQYRKDTSIHSSLIFSPLPSPAHYVCRFPSAKNLRLAHIHSILCLTFSFLHSSPPTAPSAPGTFGAPFHIPK